MARIGRGMGGGGGGGGAIDWSVPLAVRSVVIDDADAVVADAVVVPVAAVLGLL